MDAADPDSLACLGASEIGPISTETHSGNPDEARSAIQSLLEACDVRCGPCAKGQSSVILSPFGLKKQLFVTRRFHSVRFRESIRSRPRLSFEPPYAMAGRKTFRERAPRHTRL